MVRWRDRSLAVTVGFDPVSGSVREVRATGFKCGSDMQLTIDDVCVVASLALQHGASPKALTRSLGTVPVSGGEDEMSSVVGAVLSVLTEIETEKQP
ncbi:MULTISPECIES: TSCPD domain-containing protein [unclassified Paracoccus (in: a-proteobacteria)]|uniref:TSCPD domain-containing protein n=1 Tax=unclassified Paracoccus (in: a-proteobacteria) TaxID=2688777 RepID=UPI0018A6B9A2|nr:ribonucleotide reductase [Paracoccus sp. SMMA_5]UXU75546.1 hypothetical protein GB879_003365 [Paracoccus sp. SMMA_5]